MFKCIKSFSGNKVSMKKGDTIEYLDKELAEDYKRAGFIIEEKTKEIVNKIETKVKEEIKKTTSKKTNTKKKK